MALVYIVQCENAFKIGFTGGSLKDRVRSMTTGNPFPIKPILTINFNTHSEALTVEKLLHAKYKRKSLQGEWFSLSLSDVSDITIKYSERVLYVNHNIVITSGESALFWKRRYLQTREENARIKRLKVKQGKFLSHLKKIVLELQSSFLFDDDIFNFDIGPNCELVKRESMYND